MDVPFFKNIFESDDDRTLFLDLIREFSNRFSIEVYAYVLMSNHYHLLIKTLENNFSKSMQWLGTTYTRKFNINNTRGGHLFQGRFKSIIIENDAYLLQLGIAGRSSHFYIMLPIENSFYDF